MIGLGVHLQIWTGKTIPTPAPLVADLFDTLNIISKEDNTSGFEMSIRAGRSGPIDLFGYRPLTLGSIDTGYRIGFTATVRGIPRVLFDGIITSIDLAPSEKPGEGRLIVKGEELSFYMRRNTRGKTYPRQSQSVIAADIIGNYARYGVIPKIIPSPNESFGGALSKFYVKAQVTDEEFLRKLAKDLGYIFYVESGPIPGQSIAYFGPPSTAGIVQPALTVNMGAASNINNVNITENPSTVKTVETEIVDERTGKKVKIKPYSIRPGALSLLPTLLTKREMIEKDLLPPEDATTYSQASARVKGEQNKSADAAVVVKGQLDTSRYGSILKARDLVGLRGTGVRNSGWYRVKEATHTIKKGSYTQTFELQRDGTLTSTGITQP